ncbi:MAG TPA: hypothetical protein VFO93_01075 [Hymenobacter sp.]|uniref:hypothetical protein n=1 Tax=Hymenobacter sp. TaxID=1898978 RepID=UPI002D7F484C|nr:hypothetical protein [Hymenobacter sp.]HET9502101.1 hypothetical protein [Hymenobacter sp.]
MIIYGTKGTHLQTEPLPDVACPACQAPSGLRASLYSRYAHVYWIPFFPYQKLAAVQCGTCQSVWDNGQLPPGLAPAVRTRKQQTRHPYWTWAGLAAVAGLLTFGALAGMRDRHTDEALLLAPRAGDIYTVRTDSAGMYSLMKVRRVGGNNVELVANDYQVDDAVPLDKLNSPEKYGKEPFTLTRLELQIMRRKDQLTDVDRP